MAETKYEPGFTLSALNFAEAGMTDAQIAYRLNISRSTFYNYKRDYPEFVEAIERGRDILDATVNRNLLDLVTGEYCFITSSSDSDGRVRGVNWNRSAHVEAWSRRVCRTSPQRPPVAPHGSSGAPRRAAGERWPGGRPW